jgi:hypothetical protein
MVIVQVRAVNPVHRVFGLRHVECAAAKTPVLTKEQDRQLLEWIDASTVVGIRVEDHYPEDMHGWCGCTRKAASGMGCRRTSTRGLHRRLRRRPLRYPTLRSVHRAGRFCACELRDGISDPAPDRCAVVIAVGGKFIGASSAFHVGVLAVTLEHQHRGAPDVDFRYHGSKAMSMQSIII